MFWKRGNFQDCLLSHSSSLSDKLGKENSLDQLLLGDTLPQALAALSTLQHSCYCSDMWCMLTKGKVVRASAVTLCSNSELDSRRNGTEKLKQMTGLTLIGLSIP